MSAETGLEPGLAAAVKKNVADALAEDLGNGELSGDITASLIPVEQTVSARILTREAAVVCGRPWVDETFASLDSSIKIDWLVAEGEQVKANQTLLTLEGNARQLMTGERTALNFLQLLSGVASKCAHYAAIVASTKVRLLDTRKTLPGLRIAQKYATKTGACHNHRMGLYDAFLIKENHIGACGSIAAAVSTARANYPGMPVEVEVESFEQLRAALDAAADRIMLDNFTVDDMRSAVKEVDGRVELEASGNINEDTLLPYAETGVDFISIGALTKHCRAIDLSMRLKNL